MHFLSNPWVSGSINFKTPQTCAIFGVYCQYIPKKMNDLIDSWQSQENSTTEVIIMLHYLFETHHFGKTHWYLHDDYYVGQNKTTH